MDEKALIHNTDFLVIDFETLTPKGLPPEPIEIGIQKIHGLQIEYGASISWLIQPPKGFHVTKLDFQLKGITDQDLIGQQTIDEVLRKVNNTCGKREYVFIAQNAKYEANILSYHTDKYKNIAKTPIMDTILLAKFVMPGLKNYKLDTLAESLNLPIPSDRHRALADCILTAKVFIKLLDKLKECNRELVYLSDLLHIAEIETKYNQPVQLDLFDYLQSIDSKQ